jgi:Uri superfamily endonuclease
MIELAKVRGVYAVLLYYRGPLTVGALGRVHFAGLYLYIGSALGSAGLKRLTRHRQVYLGQRTTRRWHVDYLLGAGSWLGAYWREAGPGAECDLALSLGRDLAVVPGFGSSDCRCPGHLFYAPGQPEAEDLLRALGLTSYPFLDDAQRCTALTSL